MPLTAVQTSGAADRVVPTDSPAVAALRSGIAESNRAEDNATVASYTTQEGVLLSRDDAGALLKELDALRAQAMAIA